MYLNEHQRRVPGRRGRRHLPARLRAYRRSAPRSSATCGEISPGGARGQAQAASRATSRATRSASPGSRRRSTSSCAACPGKAQIRVDSLGRPQSGVEPELADAGPQRPPDARRAPAARGRAGAPLRHRDRPSSSTNWYANGGAVVALDPTRRRRPRAGLEPDVQALVYVGRLDPKKLEPARPRARRANYPALNRAIARPLPAGLDVEAGDGARGDAGGPALARTRRSSARRSPTTATTARSSRTGTRTSTRR